jgi:glycosyltransferase involved in cell wall biosynthesis
MRIVMLGWEFPPFISGGLGTACHGLTKALDRLGHEVYFILPRPVDRSHATHIKLLSPDELTAQRISAAATPGGRAGQVDPITGLPPRHGVSGAMALGFESARFIGVPASFSSPYPGTQPPTSTGRGFLRAGTKRADGSVVLETDADVEEYLEPIQSFPHTAGAGPMFGRHGAGPGYQGDLFAEAERYARLVVALTRGLNPDVIHAHDWLTFPAGIALARVTGRPLVAHVHSTEFDRSGDNVNQRVYDIERRGMLSAVRVICVSELTRSLAVRRYGIPPAKCDVVYNGIDQDMPQPAAGGIIKSATDKIVLFLGRITMQKGPEYFISAAQKVLEKVPEAKFIVAGAGDMETRMIELAAQLGIGHRVLFTGFLRGKDVERIYRMADCYVMPSVSEPFGLAPLEAMRADVPVIISKQSGVSEVLTHALKVDFWDTAEMANKIVAVLRHPPLGQTLREHGSMEIKRLTWDGAAGAVVESYQRAIDDMASMAVGVPRM